MPWGHPGEHHDFEPQRHDDGYLEVIGFTMTSLVSGPARGLPGAPVLLCAVPSTAPRWKGVSPNFPSLAGHSLSPPLSDSEYLSASLCLRDTHPSPLTGQSPYHLCLALALTSPLYWGLTLPPLSVGVTFHLFSGQSLPWQEQSWGPHHAALAPDLSPLRPQAALQVGGHGERLTQCREVVLTTSKAIPVQVDGEPCKLAASRIRIALRNQATMVQKAKRRSATPLHSEYVPSQPPCALGPRPDSALR